MTTSRFALVVAILFLFACSSAFVGESGYSPPNDTRRECSVIAAIKQRVCSVTFIELASNPRRFDGQYIRVTGFALDKNGYTYLYASKDAFVYGAARGGVDLLLSEEMQQAFSVIAHDGGKPVTAIGKFDVLRGRLRGSVGVLSGPGLSFYVDNFPWEAPELPPE